MDLLILFGGLVVLYFGGEFFIDGSSRMARLLGMSPLLVGLTVVAFGTSAPELGVSLQAALSGHASIAMGNVAGSNLFNTLVILGASALVAPLAINRKLVRFDVPLMILFGLTMGLFAYTDSNISKFEGALFLMMAVAYNIWLFRQGKKERQVAKAAGEELPQKTTKEFVRIAAHLIIGLIGLYFGSQWTVKGAVAIAESFGITERIIALTIISAGTSLPELAASVVATLKGERDLAVGNVVGSNIMNIVLILGATATVSSVGIDVEPDLINLDIPMSIFAMLLCFPFFLRDTMNRWVGGSFLAIYVGYVIYIL